MKEQVEILLKEYDLMRKEIHLYISKYYVVLTVIPGILFASAFNVDDSKYSIASVFVPYVIAAMFGYMAMTLFL